MVIYIMWSQVSCVHGKSVLLPLYHWVIKWKAGKLHHKRWPQKSKVCRSTILSPTTEALPSHLTRQWPILDMWMKYAPTWVWPWWSLKLFQVEILDHGRTWMHLISNLQVPQYNNSWKTGPTLPPHFPLYNSRSFSAGVTPVIRLIMHNKWIRKYSWIPQVQMLKQNGLKRWHVTLTAVCIHTCLNMRKRSHGCMDYDYATSPSMKMSINFLHSSYYKQQTGSG